MRACPRLLAALFSSVVLASVALPAQPVATLTAEQRDRRWTLERELQSLADVHRKVMMPMRDGVRLATDIYVPRRRPGRSGPSSSRRPTTSTSGTSGTAFPPV